MGQGRRDDMGRRATGDVTTHGRGSGRRRMLDTGGRRHGDEGRGAGPRARPEKRRGSSGVRAPRDISPKPRGAHATRIAREPTVNTTCCQDGPTAALAAGNLEFLRVSHVLSPLRKGCFAHGEPELWRHYY
jgi:hypothetical protein